MKWLKRNAVVVSLARRWFRIRTRRLERLIFTATTGRSGTMTLARAFSIVPGCIALHEPFPSMNGPVLRAATHGDAAYVNWAYRRIKSVNILRAAVGYRYYVEANHFFAKTFIEQVVKEFGSRVMVIHLVRPPIGVAVSMYCMEHYPGTEIGDNWFLSYRAPTSLIQIADALDLDPEFSHPFYKALWYWHEMELRIARWRAILPLVKFVRFETEWLNDENRVTRLLQDLGIEYDKSRVASIVGLKENIREHKKVVPALPAKQAEEMLARFRRLLHQRGVDLSPIGAAGDAPAPPVAGNSAL